MAATTTSRMKRIGEVTAEYAAARDALMAAIESRMTDRVAWWQGVAAAHDRLQAAVEATAGALYELNPTLLAVALDGAYYHRGEAAGARRHAAECAALAEPPHQTAPTTVPVITEEVA